MKLAPHEHTQTVEFLQPQFINKVVDDRVTTQIQSHSSSEDEAKQSRSLRFDSETKVVDSSCPTENRQQRTDAADAVPQSSKEERDTLNQGRQSLEHRMSSVRGQRDHLSRLDQEGNVDAGGSRTPQT